MGENHAGSPALARVLDRATVALSAEICGGTQQVVAMTTAKASEVAFGKPVARRL
jgi:hypothetical protein